MGKRSSFPRRAQDDYPTPIAALKPLLPFLAKDLPIIEPCPGKGALIAHLRKLGFIVVEGVGDARTQKYYVEGSAAFITNPPWRRDLLHPIISNLVSQAPAWLLFDADWMHCKQSIPYMPLLRVIVSVGRIKWIPGSPHTGKDNCAWYLFDTNWHYAVTTRFFGRNVPLAFDPAK